MLVAASTTFFPTLLTEIETLRLLPAKEQFHSAYRVQGRLFALKLPIIV
jgi:hypothetical protein